MKIAIVFPRNYQFDEARPNSIETVVRTLNSQSRHSDSITVIADSGGESHGDLNTIVVDPCSSRHTRNKLVIAALKELQPDYIEIHQHYLTAVAIAKKFQHVPCVLYRHNSNKARNPIKRFVYRRRLQNFHATVFVSKFLEREFLGHYSFYKGRTHVVQNAITPQPWMGSVEGKEKLIAFGGRAAPEKGFTQLCEALPILLEKYPDWKAGLCTLDFARNEKYAAPLVKPLEKFGDRVVIKKDQPLSSVQALLKRAAITIIPSVFEEPFGLAALEAHVAGSALVSSGRGGLREASGEHAVFLKEVSAGSIVEAVSQLIENEDQRLALAKSGQDYVLKNHQASQRVAELDDVRDEIMEKFKAGKA